ncbi:MAG TPA: translocation/assembly module TamB domain-containing protein [Gemmatimonadaceae bacterium]|nr:translocation/assembly module TamB domain-containing protein [Gemmatimonadaceae bacterium]
MWKVLRIVAISIVVLVLLVVGAVLGLTNTDFGRERVRRIAVKAMNKSIHGTTRIGRIDGDLLRGITLYDVSITDSAGAPFFASPMVQARYTIGTFLSKHIVINALGVDKPQVVLDKKPGAEWNFTTLFASADTTKKDTTLGFGSWITLRNVRLNDGHILVRMPWTPDDSLPKAVRDSIVRVALAGDARQKVIEAPGGYQTVMEFSTVQAALPHVRIADPDSTTRVFQVGSLAMTAALFNPPVADVKDLRGTIFMSTDSLWFRGLSAALPNTQLRGDGTYMLASGDLAASFHAAPLALADLRFAYPRMPANGSGSMDLTAAMRHAGESEYAAHNVDLTVDGGTLRGQLELAMGRTTDDLRLHDTELAFTSIDTRTIEQLAPTLKSPRRGTLSGRATLAGTTAAMQVDADVAFTEPRSGTSRVLVVGVAGSGRNGFTAKDLRVTITPLQMGLARVFAPSLPIGGVLTGKMTLDGTLAGRMTASADIEHKEGADITRMVANGEAVRSGKDGVSADMRFDPISLITAGKFAPALGLRGVASGTVHVGGSMRAMDLTADLHLPDGGELATTGKLDLVSAEKGYDLETHLRLFNLRSVVSRGPVTSLTASAMAKGRGFDPKTMHAAFAANVLHSAVDSLAVDSANIRIAVADGIATMDSVTIHTPFAQLFVDGTIGTAPSHTGQLRYIVSVDTLAALRRFLASPDSGVVRQRPAIYAAALARAKADSARQANRNEVAERATGKAQPQVKLDSLRALRKDSVDGALRTAGIVSGTISDFNVRGRLAAEHIIARGSGLNRARVEYAVTNGGSSQMKYFVGGELDSLSASGFALDSATIQATYAQPSGSVELAVYQDSGYVYRVGADFLLSLDSSQVMWRTLSLQLDSAQWKSAAPGFVQWGKRGIRVHDLDLRSGTDGRIYANGDLPVSGPMDMLIGVSGLQISNLVGLAESDVSATGVIDLRAKLAGTQRDPAIRGAFSVTGASFKNSPLPDLRTAFQYADERLVSHADLMRNGGAPLARLDIDAPINLALEGATGSRMLDRPLKVDFLADSLPLDALPRFTDLVSNVHGRVIGAVAARGTGTKPLVLGQLGLDFATFKLEPLGVSMTDIGGLIHMTGTEIVIDTIGGKSGEGSFTMAGKIGIADGTNPTFDLKFDAKDATVLDNDIGELHANADIALKGPMTGTAVSGRARIVHGTIYIPNGGGPRQVSSDDPAVLSVVDTSDVRMQKVVNTESTLMENMTIDVKLSVARDTWARSPDANVEFYTQGPLTVLKNKEDEGVSIDGVVNTERGEYAFLGRRFVLTQGSAIFTGGSDLNPLLQLGAQYTIQPTGRPALNINIAINGTVRRPIILLTSDAQPPLSQSDLLSYLAFGQSSTSLVSSASSSSTSGGGNLVGSAAALATRQLTATALGVMTRQFAATAARSLGADVFTITPADVPDAGVSINGVRTILAGTQIEAGKYVDRQTYVATQIRGQGTTPGFVVQRRLSKGYRIEASIDSRFLVNQPTLSSDVAIKSEATFGAFFIREWKF